MEDITELIPNEVSQDGDTRPVEPSLGPPGRAGGPAQGEPTQSPVGDVWSVDKRGKQYISAQGRKGIIYREGDETVAEAIARDQRPRAERPKRKKPPTPPAPTKTDLKELEHVLAEAFTSPAMLCAAFGDEWAANHFALQGPALARNLVNASDHNPWLKKQLERAASGEALTMQLMTLLGVGGALFAYAVPPVIYWFNLPVPGQARMMFNIPDRREHVPEPETPAAYPAAA